MAAKQRNRKLEKTEAQVTICGINYDVRFEKLKKDEKDRVYPKIPAGRANSQHTLVQIDTNQSDERRYEIFIHECLHMLIYESACQDFIKQGQEENLVGQLSAPLAAFIRDNVELLSDVGGF